MTKDDKFKVNVLFVCIGNACRSPMAEAIARKSADDVIHPFSAGLYPLGEVPVMTRVTLTSNGYSTEELNSKGLGDLPPEEMQYVINISGQEKPIALKNYANIENWDVTDPYGADASVYQKILEELEERVNELAARLRRKYRSTDD